MGGAIEIPFGALVESNALDFEALYDKYGAQVLRWAKHLGGPEVDAEDIAQEVFFQAYSKRGAFRGQVHVSAWLYRLTVNVVARRTRRERGWQRLASVLRRGRPPPVSSALENLELHQQRELLYRALNNMPARERTLLIAFVIDGLSGREISELFNLKLGSVWTWLSRARSDFRRRLINLGISPDL
jgi:RNA polymerase sigma-70 factor, ECF subfamily